MENQWIALFKISDTEEWQEMFCKLVGAYYTSSLSFGQADERFLNALEPMLDKFNLEALCYLLNGIEGNAQCHDRWRAPKDYTKIEKRILDVDGEKFDFSPYPSFKTDESEGASME